MRSLQAMADEEEAKKEQIKRDVLERKVARAKGMLKCAAIYLLPNGLFAGMSICVGCPNDTTCCKIKRIVERDIKRAYDMVK